MPELFRDRTGWRARHPGVAVWDIDLEGHEPTPVPARAGDLIVFDAMLPHGTEGNGSTAPRLAQYVTMTPPEGDPEWRIGLYREGRSPFPAGRGARRAVAARHAHPARAAPARPRRVAQRSPSAMSRRWRASRHVAPKRPSAS